MPVLISPVTDPAGWTVQVAAPLTLPDGLRYAGYTLHGLLFTRASAAGVVAPCRSHLRTVSEAGLGEVVEFDPLPMGMRRVLRQLGGGVPTFYAIFPAGTGLSVSGGDAAGSNDTVASAARVTIGVIDQTRRALSVAETLRRIDAAMLAAGDATPLPPGAASLGDLVAAIDAALSGPSVMLLDAAGRRVESASVAVTPAGGAPSTLSLQASDAGDLGLALTRARVGDPAIPADLLSPGASIARTGGNDGDQWASLDDPSRHGAGALTLGADTHLMHTRLPDWFAAQAATPTGAAGPALPDFTRGNALRTFVNGPAYFEDLMAALHQANAASGGFHLAGYSVHPQAPLLRRRWNDALETTLSVAAAEGRAPAGEVPITLEQALTRIAGSGGGARVLPLDFIQPNSSGSAAAIGIVIGLMMAGFGYVGVADALQTSSDRTNDAGMVALIGAIAAGMIAGGALSASDFAALEPNGGANTTLNALANVVSRLDALPTSVDDNPDVVAAAPGFPFDQVFDVIDRFGSFHQKIALVKPPAGLIAYCGGIDINPDRLDDVNHLADQPYADTQVRLEGPAARDLAVTFEERWSRDAAAGPVAFAAPDAATLGTPGEMAVQVARTYPSANAAARRLDFAPQGDPTLGQSILKGIAAAREHIFIQDQYFTPPPSYRDALRAKVTNREIKSLVITLPDITDQPFGIESRNAFIADLMAEDGGAGIVKVGYMRRKYSVPNTTTGAMFGKLRLAAAMTDTDAHVFLTPATRLPEVPFWLCVNGELMWVTGGLPPGAPETPSGATGFAVTRGGATHLFAGPPTVKGASARSHPDKSAATMVRLPGVYMHSKLMIVDDVFLSIGSANINRRGLAHDAECNIFAIPQRLRADPDNPIARFRAELTAELLDLPNGIAQPLLRDPYATARLLNTDTLSGNRFRKVDAVPAHPFLDFSLGGGMALALNTALFVPQLALRDDFFDFVVDPTTDVEALLPGAGP